jgi:hypothetical protein
MIVMEAKNNICMILDMICDIRLDHRLTGLLKNFKQYVEGGMLNHEQERERERESEESERARTERHLPRLCVQMVFPVPEPVLILV